LSSFPYQPLGNNINIDDETSIKVVATRLSQFFRTPLDYYHIGKEVDSHAAGGQSVLHIVLGSETCERSYQAATADEAEGALTPTSGEVPQSRAPAHGDPA
jgi:hypothetical protein